MERSRGGFNILSLGRWVFLAFLLAFTALPSCSQLNPLRSAPAGRLATGTDNVTTPP